MAEVIGTAASVSALIDLTGQILVKGCSYISKVAKAPETFRRLVIEVTQISAVLVRLQPILDGERDHELLTRMEDGVLLEQCNTVLAEIDSHFRKFNIDASDGLQKVFQRLVWPALELKIENMIKKLSRYQRALSDALAAETAAGIARLEMQSSTRHIELKACVEEAGSRINSLERKLLFDWICPFVQGPESDYESAIESRTKGTTTWLFQSAQYSDWIDGPTSCLLLSGLPGSGKTILAGSSIEQLRSERVNSNTAVIYHFFDYLSPNKTTETQWLLHTIRQLLQQRPEAIVHVQELYEQCGSMPPTANACRSLVELLLSKFDATYMVVDGLEECIEVIGILTTLSRLLSTRHGKILRVFLSARDTNTVLKYFEEAVKTIQLPIEDRNKDDIHKHITKLMNALPVAQKLPQSSRDELLVKICAQARGLFTQAISHINLLGGCRRLSEFKGISESLPNSLDGTYRVILDRIQMKYPQDIPLIQKMLKWLCESNYCLPVNEFPAVLSISRSDTHVDFDEIIIDYVSLYEMLGCLINLDHRLEPPELALAHSTIEEYLHTPEAGLFYVDRMEVQKELAETCAQYCSSLDFETPIVDLVAVNQPGANHGEIAFSNPFKKYLKGLGFPFSREDPNVEAMEKRLETYQALYYASHNWPEHVRRAQYTAEDYENHLKQRLQWFLNPNQHRGQYRSWQEAHAYYCALEYCDCHFWQPPFYFAICFGLQHCFKTLLPFHCHDLDRVFPGGNTPLIVALRSGNLVIARSLLDAGASPSILETIDYRQKLVRRLERCQRQGNYDASETNLSNGDEDTTQFARKCHDSRQCHRCSSTFIIPSRLLPITARLTEIAVLSEEEDEPESEIVCPSCREGWSQQGYNIRTDPDPATDSGVRILCRKGFSRWSESGRVFELWMMDLSKVL